MMMMMTMRPRPLCVLVPPHQKKKKKEQLGNFMGKGKERQGIRWEEGGICLKI